QLRDQLGDGALWGEDPALLPGPLGDRKSRFSRPLADLGFGSASGTQLRRGASALGLCVHDLQRRTLVETSKPAPARPPPAPKTGPRLRSGAGFGGSH